MADTDYPGLRLQRDLTRRPYGGAWWPSGRDLAQQMRDLADAWPADRPAITRYVYLPPDVQRSDPAIMVRTRTLVLSLDDGTTCRLLLVPPETPSSEARDLLAQASDPESSWTRADFSTAGPAPTRDQPSHVGDRTDA